MSSESARLLSGNLNQQWGNNFPETPTRCGARAGDTLFARERIESTDGGILD